jgi:hypothetical protein
MVGTALGYEVTTIRAPAGVAVGGEEGEVAGGDVVGGETKR